MRCPYAAFQNAWPETPNPPAITRTFVNATSGTFSG
jgi:hypothetical protein